METIIKKIIKIDFVEIIEKFNIKGNVSKNIKIEHGRGVLDPTYLTLEVEDGKEE